MSKSETAGEEFEIFVQDRDAYLQHVECFCRAVRGEDVALEGLERIISLGRLLALLHHIVQHLSTYTHHNTHTPHHNTHTPQYSTVDNVQHHLAGRSRIRNGMLMNAGPTKTHTNIFSQLHVYQLPSTHCTTPF